MPKIKKTKNQVIVVGSTTAKTEKKTKKTARIKPNPVDYYACLTGMAQAGFPGKISACCRSCRNSTPVLNNQRQQELQQ